MARLRLYLAFSCAIFTAFAGQAFGQAAYIPILRDAEGEAVLNELLTPIAEAAGLEADAVHPRLVDHASVNAFVSYGQDVFVHSGVILGLDDVSQVQGILAHEVGHIAGAHAVRRDLAKRKSRGIVVGHMLLGAGVFVAESLDASGADTDALGKALTVVGAGYQMQGNYLAAHDRRQEYAADQAAVTYLARANLPLEGLIRVFQRTLVPDNRAEAQGLRLYARSHPDMEDRIRALEGRIAEEDAKGMHDEDTLLRYRLFKAKMLGQVFGPGAVEGRYYDDLESTEALYAMANALYAQGDMEAAYEVIQKLTKTPEATAYFYELEGSILLRLGRPQDAIAPLARANALSPNTPLLMIQESAARLTAAGDPDTARAARARLEAATTLDDELIAGWHLLGLAEHRLGNEGGVQLALAHKHFLMGDTAAARHYAKLAHSGLPYGSPQWVQADYLLNAVGGGTSP